MRILQMNIDNKGTGGAYVLIRRIEEILSSEGVNFDYLTMRRFDENAPLMPCCGSKQYNADLRKNRLIGHIKLPFYVYKVVRKNNYKIIHINSDMSWKMLLYAIPSRMAGANCIILHAHSTGIDGDHKLVKRMCQIIASPFMKFYGDQLLACSDEAADYVFGRKLCLKKGYKIIKNGIDIKKFKFDELQRTSIRKELGVRDDELLIGNTSRIAYQKNPLFLMEVFFQLNKKMPNSKLLFVGGGDEKYIKLVQNYVNSHGLKDRVIFLGHLDSVAPYLSALDVFVFPSLFEGLGISLIEAQAAGLPCVISDKVPSLAIVTKDAHVLPISLSHDKWAREIQSLAGIRTTDAHIVVGKSGFTTEGAAEELLKIYKSLEER